MGLFSELQSLGIDENPEIYLNNEKVTDEPEKKVRCYPLEWEKLFEKTMECPCCGIDFPALTVRAGKLQPISYDMDLRPVYENFDPLKYEAVMCPICGYSALAGSFDEMIPVRIRKISDTISQKFVGLEHFGMYYTYDDAILRYKMALLCDVIGYAMNSQRAYTCLKLSWVVRGKLEYEKKQLTPRRIKELEADEYDCIYNAFEGFELAYTSENFPMFGMDKLTVTYLLAVLGYKLKKYEESAKYIYKIFGANNVPPKLREMTRALKTKVIEDVRAEKAEKAEQLELELQEKK